jgi:hypothetical protein
MLSIRQLFENNVKINAPSFIYQILHGKFKYLSGKTNHEKIIYNGIQIDKNIPVPSKVRKMLFPWDGL